MCLCLHLELVDRVSSLICGLLLRGVSWSISTAEELLHLLLCVLELGLELLRVIRATELDRESLLHQLAVRKVERVPDPRLVASRVREELDPDRETNTS